VLPLSFGALITTMACTADRPDASGAEANGPPVLVLHRSFELAPAVGEAIDRLLPVNGGGVFVRTRTQDFLLRTDGRTVLSTLAVALRYDPIGLRLANDSIMELVDAARSVIVSADLASRRTVERAFHVPFVPSVAVWHRGAWILGGARSKTLFQLVRIAPGDAAPSSFGVYKTSDDRSLSLYVTSGHGDALIGTEINVPFVSVAFDRHGRSRLLIEAPAAILELAFDERRRLVSLPVLMVPCGYVQMVSDINSDDRWLIVADRDGAVVQWRHLAAPIGLTVSLSEPNLLIGAMTADSSSLLVGYETEGLCADLSSSDSA
jgi:hypothetical protein